MLKNNTNQFFRALIKEFPNSVYVYIGWSDLYWLFRISDKIPCDYEKAEKIYRKALENNIDDRQEVIERLKELEKEKQKAGRMEGGKNEY